MVNVIGVRFQQNGKMYYFDADNHTPAMGDFVIVNTERGLDLGEVMMGVRPVEDDLFRTPLLRMVRPANEQDLRRATDNRARETEAFQICQKKIAEHRLDMKLVSVECSFDNSKILFYFTANGRVDFRALVKDLAFVFKTRIELRQIGVRDEARMLGGLGPCGRTICCGAFLSDFQPVSIKMAKEQNLSLNPTKISGVCGRLMCCLKYEQDQYEQTRKRMPRVGREVVTPDGNGIVSDLNIVKETVSVRITRGDENEIREYPLDQISRPGAGPRPEGGSAAGRPASAEGEEGTLPADQASPTQVSPDAKESDGALPPPDPERESREETSGTGHSEGDRRRSGRSGRPRPPRGNDRRGQKNENSPRGKQPRESKKEGEGAPEQKLGQPVRRENTARPRLERKPRPEGDEQKASVGTGDARQDAPAVSGRGADAGDRPKKRASGWADALEKAMKAADDK